MGESVGENETSGTDAPTPDVLYHYTGQAGLLGIIEFNAIYASKIQYFNDSAEFHLALDLATEMLKDEDVVGRPDPALIQELVSRVESVRQANVFALSLSEEGDLLSQWRAYGSPGTSFAIGFKSDLLVDIADESGVWELTQCIYRPESHARTIRDVVRDAVASDDHAEAVRNLRMGLVTLGPVMKHPSFEEEGEWRVVSSVLPEDFPFDYRVGRFTPIPYALFPIRTLNHESAIKEIVVGPTPHRDLAIMAAASLLRKHGITADVRASGTTFREW